MQLLSWTPEHSAALREFVERGMSYADAADAVNARFGTTYSRSAAIGRAKRMGAASAAISAITQRRVSFLEEPTRDPGKLDVVMARITGRAEFHFPR